MSKTLQVNPNDKRKKGVLSFNDIPLNTYQKKVKDEKNNYSKDQFLKIYRDMLIIREFESMLNSIKVTGQYEGVEYNHPGPAHLGIGQEAAYVGQAFDLNIEDYTFGSHRSHGEILAKGLSAIEKLEDKSLLDIMKGFFDGATWAVVEKKHSVQRCKRYGKGVFNLWYLGRNLGKRNWL